MADWTLYQLMTVVAGLLLLGVFSSRISSRLNMPILLLFLGTGMLIGSRHFGYIEFETGVAADVALANTVGTLAMAFILYSGGLETNFRTIRAVLAPGVILSTLGVLLTAMITGAAGCWLLGWSPAWGMLLGAVVSSTDAAAVFAILRSRQVSLRGRLKPLLEFESGSNDPMAALLTLFMIGFLQHPEALPLWSFPFYFLFRMAAGALLGYAAGRLGCWLFNRAKLEYEGLYFVLGVAIVLLSYGATETLHANGFMAAYCAGLAMGNVRYNYQRGQLRFMNGLAWLMQVAMFTVLGMLVTTGELVAVPAAGWTHAVWFRGMLIALVLMFVARPAAVFVGMIRSRFNWRERLLVSWVGLRGAAPIVLATFPLAAGLSGNAAVQENAGTLFNLVFCVVIASVLIQSKTLMPLARLLKLDAPLREKERVPLELEETGVINSVMHEFEVTADAQCSNKSLAELNLPSGILVLLIRRGNSFILARGNTAIREHDGLLMMGDEAVMRTVAEKYFPDNDYFGE